MVSTCLHRDGTFYNETAPDPQSARSCKTGLGHTLAPRRDTVEAASTQTQKLVDRAIESLLGKAQLTERFVDGGSRAGLLLAYREGLNTRQEQAEVDSVPEPRA